MRTPEEVTIWTSGVDLWSAGIRREGEGEGEGLAIAIVCCCELEEKTN